MRRDALVVGVNQYPFLKENPTSPAKHLTTPAGDAEAIAQLLEQYGDFQVQQLPASNQDGKLRVDSKKLLKVADLQEAITELFQPTGHHVPETAILFFAGHGLRKSLDGGTEGYLATSDANPRKGLWGLSLRWLRQLLQESPVRQQIIWLDCCHSGELLNFAETDLGEYEKGRDRCFIVASRDFQVAYAAVEGEHGVLSGALLQGLDPTLRSDKWVTNYSLVDFVKQALKEAPQHPICTNSGGQIILTGEQSVISSTCPYKGLAYFDFNEEDPKYFYGRTALTNQLLEKVRSSNFLAVLGASGSGKSSVVRAGLLHQLKLGEAIPGSDRWNLYEPFTPAEHPLRSLEQVVGVLTIQLEAFLKAAPAKRVVLVVDQFEEAFTLCRDEAERKQFFECLMDAVKRVGNKLCLVLVMRDDFQHKCAEQDYTGLATKIDQNLVRVRQMSREELKEAITKPAQQVGKEEQLVAKRIFLELTHLGEATGDTCKQVRQQDLVNSQQSEVLVNQVVQRLADTKLVVTSEQELGDKRVAVVNIAHEALIRNWQQLRHWLKENRDALLRKQDIEDAAKEWREKGKPNDSAYLLQGRRLSEAENFQQTKADTVPLSGVAQEFVQQSIETRKSSHRRIAGIVTVVILGLSGLAGWALIERENAQIRAISASSEALFASDRDLDALLESLRAVRRLKQAVGVKTETRNRVVTALQQVIYGVRERNRLEHRDSVKSVSFSPDGQSIATASSNINDGHGTVRLWSRDGSLLKTIEAYKVSDVRFSPDGQTIASVDNDGVKLWSRDGTLLKSLKGNRGHVNFSPDSQTIGVADVDGMVKLWTRHGTLLKTMQADIQTVYDVSFSPNGQIIASCGTEGVKLWSVDGTLLKTLQGSSSATSVSFSPDGNMIAFARYDTVEIQHIDGGLIETLQNDSTAKEAGAYTANSVSFSPDGQTLATASRDSAVRIWSINGKLLRILKGHNSSVNDVRFSPDGKTIASASLDGTVRLWSQDGISLTTKHLQGHGSIVWDVSFSPDGKTIASSSKDRTVKLWSRDGTLLKTLEGDTDSLEISSVSFSPDSKMLVSAEGSKVKLWSRDGALVRTLQENSYSVFDVSFSPDSKILASANNDKTVKLWSADGTLLKTLQGHRDAVTGVSFSPDGQMIASASWDNTVKLWSIDGQLLKTLEGHGDKVAGVSVSPDSQMIASASWDATVKLWRRDGKLLKTLQGHSNKVWKVSFSPDSTMLATASADNTVKLWSRDGTLLKTLQGHDLGIAPQGENIGVTSVTFNPNGTRLISAGADETLIIWNLDLDDLRTQSCDWVRDYLNNNPNGQKERYLCR